MDGETTADCFVGIDVSKARVEVHVRPDGAAFGCATDREGLGALVARLQPLSPCLIVIEASGGYEGVVAAALAEAGLPVAIVNPRQVRKFAGAIGRLAKTDAIEAAVIAHFAQAVRPTPRPLPDDLAVRLAELMARRRQLVVMINAEKQRLGKTRDRDSARLEPAIDAADTSAITATLDLQDSRSLQPLTVDLLSARSRARRNASFSAGMRENGPVSRYYARGETPAQHRVHDLIVSGRRGRFGGPFQILIRARNL